MRSAIFLALLGALGAASGSLADPTSPVAPPVEPDYALAYKLATASYCVYALGDQEQDRGKDRAANCLKAAAATDARFKASTLARPSSKPLSFRAARTPTC
jgi:hypothetical protein